MAISRLAAPTLVVAAGLAIISANLAEARLGGGRSFGSRGSRTYIAPPATNTAPSAAPLERSMTDKRAAASAQNTQPAAGGSMLARFGGVRGILMGGVFAVGLGSIFGSEALAGALGFLLQLALLAGVVYLAVSFFRSRGQPAPARAGTHADASPPQPDRTGRGTLGANGGSAGLASTFKIRQEDLDSFERLLSEIQTAYSREDADDLGAKTTPEMLSHFLQDISDNAKQGVRNNVSDVKLLQGDVAEAWRENGSDYATVAMRYALTDVTVDRASGHVVSGDAPRAGEATELWTFRRDDRAPADGWQLSAIQQTA
jgi:predicted lipid-binding transport protein (Tim44 family)